MAELKGSETAANLVEAFLAESQASRRYLYFAQQADVDGRPEVAALFRTVAETETGHAFGHIDFLVDVGDPATGLPIGATEDNLASAVVSEREEGREMYPRFAETARREGFTEVADWMETLARAEQDNADRFARALDDLH
jgi:rubrerythrin